MSSRKIPENEIHKLAIDLAKMIPIHQPAFEQKKIAEEFMISYNRIYDALLEYNEKAE